MVKKGKTPVWSREDAKTLLDSIPKDSVCGLRDLALIAAMFYSFARVLDPGAGFSAPVQQVSPFNERAVGEVADWQKYREPTRDYDETVFNVVPYGDENGETLAVLHNAAGDLGVSLGFNIQQLPVFSLWKNTDTMGQGYVTGLEPGTSWAYNRSYQRALNRVPTIGPKEQRHFDITYTFLADKSAVDSALQQVQKIQHDRPTEVRKSPLVELPKN